MQAIGRGFAITDPFVTLAIAATVTESVQIGTAVVQVPLYHPVDLAHRVFSLMQVCGDRFQFGVGAGSTQKDFDAFGRDYETRFRTFSQRVTELRRIFADGKLGDVELSPWPVVRGGPPMLLGAWGGTGVERAARSYSGWIASAAYRSQAEVIAALQRYRASRRTTRDRLDDSVGTHHRSRRDARDVERIRNRRIRRCGGDVVAGRAISRRGAAAALTEALKGRQASIGDVQSKCTVHAVSQYVRPQRQRREPDPSTIASARNDRARRTAVQPLQLLRVDRQIDDDAFVPVQSEFRVNGWAVELLSQPLI